MQIVPRKIVLQEWLEQMNLNIMSMPIMNVPYAKKEANTCAEYVGDQFVFFSAPSKTQSLKIRSTGQIRQRMLDVVNFCALIVGNF